MNKDTIDTPLRAAGLALIAGSLAFVAVFSYLAATFGYPDVLDRPAAEVLPRLAAGGPGLRAVWLLYGALPLVFVFAGVASGGLLDRTTPRMHTLGVGAAVTAGVAMMVGLLRWPTIEWALAQHWGAGGGANHALAAVFDATNLFFGTLIGEFVGEMATATWFFTLAHAFRRGGRRLLGATGLAAAGLMAVAALRNLTDLVAPVAALNNIVLPLWMIALGVLFFRQRPAAEDRPAPLRPAVEGP